METMTKIVIKRLNKIKDVMTELKFFSDSYHDYLKEKKDKKV